MPSDDGIVARRTLVLSPPNDIDSFCREYLVRGEEVQYLEKRCWSTSRYALSVGMASSAIGLLMYALLDHPGAPVTGAVVGVFLAGLLGFTLLTDTTRRFVVTDRAVRLQVGLEIIEIPLEQIASASCVSVSYWRAASLGFSATKKAWKGNRVVRIEYRRSQRLRHVDIDAADPDAFAASIERARRNLSSIR